MDELISLVKSSIESGDKPSEALREAQKIAGDNFGTMTVIHILRSLSIPFDTVRKVQQWVVLVGDGGISDEEMDVLLLPYIKGQ
ncbi:hypothetical protein [Deinococcus yunweiensis]|uniref:hypothetical protein n=1 Tax=Deinococcus yunweiensis TaxID=367282 RepID=UPI00398F6278